MQITEKISEKCKNIKQPPIVISFIGDSVTQGCFELYAKGDGLETVFRPDKVYSAKLKTLIEGVFPNVTVNILNAGISGDTAPNGASRIDTDIISHKPDLCVVCYGLNDSTRGLKGIENYKNGLSGIFSKLKKAQIETVFMTPNIMATYITAEVTRPGWIKVFDDICKTMNGGIFDKYMDAARNICSEYNIPVCDCCKKWQKLNSLGADTTRLLANRANHPSEDMHWLFAVSLFDMIMGF